MTNMTITDKPVTKVTCNSRGCKGTLWRITLSRLEERLGHEGFKCAKCMRRVKYVPSPGGR